MAVHSKGATLSIEITSTMTPIPGVTGFQVPGAVTSEIETTDLDSTAKEFILDLPDGGEISFTLNLKKPPSGNGYNAAQTKLETAYNAGTLEDFEIEMPATFGVSYAFSAYVRQFQPTAGVGAPATAAVSLRVSGPVVKTVAS